MSQEETVGFMQAGRTFECAHCKGDKYLDAEKEYGIKCDCTCHDSHPIEPQGSWEEEIMKTFIKGDKEINEITFTFEIFDIFKNILTEAIKEERERFLFILEDNRDETLWGDDDSNEIMKDSIENFIVAVKDALLTNKDNE